MAGGTRWNPGENPGGALDSRAEHAEAVRCGSAGTAGSTWSACNPSAVASRSMAVGQWADAQARTEEPADTGHGPTAHALDAGSSRERPEQREVAHKSE